MPPEVLCPFGPHLSAGREKLDYRGSSHRSEKKRCLWPDRCQVRPSSPPQDRPLRHPFRQLYGHSGRRCQGDPAAALKMRLEGSHEALRGHVLLDGHGAVSVRDGAKEDHAFHCIALLDTVKLIRCVTTSCNSANITHGAVCVVLYGGKERGAPLRGASPLLSPRQYPLFRYARGKVFPSDPRGGARASSIDGTGRPPSPPSAACAAQSEGGVPPLSCRCLRLVFVRRIQHCPPSRAEQEATRHPHKEGDCAKTDCPPSQELSLSSFDLSAPVQRIRVVGTPTRDQSPRSWTPRLLFSRGWVFVRAPAPVHRPSAPTRAAAEPSLLLTSSPAMGEKQKNPRVCDATGGSLSLWPPPFGREGEIGLPRVITPLGEEAELIVIALSRSAPGPCAALRARPGA